MKLKASFLKNKFLYLILISSLLIAQEVKKTQPIEEKKEKEITIDYKKEIVFGQSIYKSGSFKLYGKIIEKAILACFNRINKQGGIKGKTLRLISMDDKGIPDLAEKNVKLMQEKYKIDMFLGNMGTRSILKILPLIQDGKIAMFFPWAGDDKLQNPQLTHIINGPGLIKPQIDAIVDYINDHLKFKKIAIFHADDNFSINNASNTIKSMQRLYLEPIKTVSFNRFTLDIQSAADKLLEKEPKVVICLSTSNPTAKLISRFFEKGSFGTYFFGIDSTLFVGDILREKGAIFYYSAAVPDPKEAKVPIVKQYQEDLEASFPKESFNILSLTYYIAARIITQVIKEIPDQITKEKIIQQIENMQNFDLAGFEITFDPKIRHAFGKNISIIKG